MAIKTILVAILMVIVFAVGFLIGRVTAGQNIGIFSGSEMKNSDDSGQGGNAGSSMTDEQRKMLSAMGIDPNTVNVTPEMIACAETKLGASRVNEIKNGAKPTFSEGASLVVCYK